MTKSELKLAARLLDLASDTYGNHSCNDFNLARVMPDVEERRALMRDYHNWNGDPEEFDEQGLYECEADFLLMGWMSRKLEEAARTRTPAAAGL